MKLNTDEVFVTDRCHAPILVAITSLSPASQPPKEHGWQRPRHRTKADCHSPPRKRCGGCGDGDSPRKLISFPRTQEVTPWATKPSTSRRSRRALAPRSTA